MSIITPVSYYFSSTFSTLAEPAVESEWAFIEIKMPENELLDIESWVSWSSGYGDYESESWWWFFRKYTIEIDDVHAEGYKDDVAERFCISYVSFRAKFTGGISWSGGNKRWASDVRVGYSNYYPALTDHLSTDPETHPSTSWSTTTHSWGIFNDYDTYTMKYCLSAFHYSSLKANVISSLEFAL